MLSRAVQHWPPRVRDPCDKPHRRVVSFRPWRVVHASCRRYLLVTHPEAMAKARAEVRQQLPPGDAYGSMQQYKACSYLNHVLLEALRIFNPVPTITRELVKDEVVCGKTLPGGVRGGGGCEHGRAVLQPV